eukprot:2586870-Rhodomonas_salina.4
MVVALAESEALMGMDPGQDAYLPRLSLRHLQRAPGGGATNIWGRAARKYGAARAKVVEEDGAGSVCGYQALDFEGRTPSCSPPPSEEEGEEERARARGEERERGEDVRMRGVGEEGGGTKSPVVLCFCYTVRRCAMLAYKLCKLPMRRRKRAGLTRRREPAYGAQPMRAPCSPVLTERMVPRYQPMRILCDARY